MTPRWMMWVIQNPHIPAWISWPILSVLSVAGWFIGTIALELYELPEFLWKGYKWNSSGKE